MINKYKIKPLILLLRDEASVKFHVASADYFGTMAAVLELMSDDIKKGGQENKAVLFKTILSLKKDLLFLQKNYQIKPKTKKRNITPKGKLKSQ